MCSRDKFPAKSSKLTQEYIDLWTERGSACLRQEAMDWNYFCTVISKILVKENIFYFMANLAARWIALLSHAYVQIVISHYTLKKMIIRAMWILYRDIGCFDLLFEHVRNGLWLELYNDVIVWICKTIWIFFYVFPVSGSGGVPYLKIVNFQSSDIRRNTEPGWKIGILGWRLTFIRWHSSKY